MNTGLNTFVVLVDVSLAAHFGTERKEIGKKLGRFRQNKDIHDDTYQCQYNQDYLQYFSASS